MWLTNVTFSALPESTAQGARFLSGLRVLVQGAQPPRRFASARLPALVLLYPSTDKVWQTLNTGKCPRVSQPCDLFWSCARSNLRPLFWSGLPNIRGAAVVILWPLGKRRELFCHYVLTSGSFFQCTPLFFQLHASIDQPTRLAHRQPCCLLR